MISEWIISILILFGALFMLLSSIGLLRFPDLYIRMHATTKATTMGLLLFFIALGVYAPQPMIIIKSLFIIIYIFMTTPVASHMIGKAGHLTGVPKWKKTHIDDLEKDEKDNDNPV